MRSIFASVLLAGFAASGADMPHAAVSKSIEAQGGEVVRAADGAIVEISLARTWATDNDVERLAEIKTLKRLDLSFTYVSDRGIERIAQLPGLEELTLDTAEFITDAATSYLRAAKHLRKLSLRGTDVTDISMPYLAELTTLRSLDLSFTMLGEVGMESLPALIELEELNLGGTHINGINLNFLKLLPKLRKLSFNGIQRRNAGACWSPLIVDQDLDAIAQLASLEDLNLGIGVSLGRGPAQTGTGNCRVTGGIKISDAGVAKLARLKKLRRLDLSGAKLTATGLKALQQLPLERLSLWNCTAIDDSTAPILAGIPTLTTLDLSYTGAGDAALKTIAALPRLQSIYLTDTKVTPDGAEAFRKQKPGVFVSWALRPAPKPSTYKPGSGKVIEQ